MARFENLSEEVLDAVVRDVGRRLGRVIAAAQETSLPGTPELFTFADASDAAFNLTGDTQAGTPTSMAESFSVWVLKADALAQDSDDIRELAENTDRWHHQIKIDDKPTSYALSAAGGPKSAEWSVRELFESSLAEKISAAIDTIDEADIPDTYIVRLLKAPAYLIEAFWLLDEQSGNQSILVIEQAPGATRLEVQILYEAKEFLAALRELPVVQGLAIEGQLGGSNGTLGSPRSNDGFEIDIRIRIREPQKPLLGAVAANSPEPTCVQGTCITCGSCPICPTDHNRECLTLVSCIQTCASCECEDNRGAHGR